MSRKNTPPQIVPGEIVKTDEIKFRPFAHKPSVYQPVLDLLKTMKKGQSTTIPVPANVESRKIQNRLASAIRNQGIAAPEGCVFTKRMTEDGRLAISVVADELDAGKIARKVKAAKKKAAK